LTSGYTQLNGSRYFFFRFSSALPSLKVGCCRMETSALLPVQASWNGTVIARSDDIVTVEGNAYFPPAALQRSCLRESSHRTVCGWKGEAHYFDVVVDGKVNANAAWTYPDPKPAAEEIRGRVAFWKGVSISQG